MDGTKVSPGVKGRCPSYSLPPGKSLEDLVFQVTTCKNNILLPLLVMTST